MARTLIDPPAAQHLIADHIEQLDPIRCALADAVGLTLAEELAPQVQGQWSNACATPGMEVTSLVTGLAASLGRSEVSVLPPPSLAVITTGQELDRIVTGVHCELTSAVGQMVCAGSRRCGVGSTTLLHAADSVEDLAFVIEHAREADLLVVTGGGARGPEDLLPRVLETLEAEILLHGVNQQPGGSMLFARLGSTPLFGLPRDPTGALLCFQRYVAPALRQMMGRPTAPTFTGRLTTPLTVTARQSLMLLAKTWSNGEGYHVQPLLGGNGSVPATAYLSLPPGEHALPDGSEVTWEWLT